MKVNRIDHISIAVRDLDAARRIWEPLLGKQGPDDAYEDDAERIRVARYWIGEVGFELMESTAADGDVARYIDRHGEGVMLVSLNVDDTRGAIAELREAGHPVIGDARTFRDCEFAFVHPRSLNGVLLEVIDDRRGPGPGGEQPG